MRKRSFSKSREESNLKNEDIDELISVLSSSSLESTPVKKPCLEKSCSQGDTNKYVLCLCTVKKILSKNDPDVTCSQQPLSTTGVCFLMICTNLA